MSRFILKDDNTPFANREAAKAKRTRMGDEGLDTNIIEIEGGFALEKKPEQRRKKRVPIATRHRLTIKKEDKDPGYHYRVVNNDDGRVEMFEQAGYEVVRKKTKIGDDRIGDTTQLGSAVTKPVGDKRLGILMRIKKEWYDEDQEAKMMKLKEAMKAIKREPERPGQYGEIKIRR